MKRTVLLVLLLLAGVTAQSSLAAAKVAKPVKTTFNLHGISGLGNVDEKLSHYKLEMTTAPPSTSHYKEYYYAAAIAATKPDPKCAATEDAAHWTGSVTGMLTGKVTGTVYLRGDSGAMDIALYRDVTDLNCNVTPIGTATVKVPSGLSPAPVPFTITLRGKVPVKSALVLQVTPGTTNLSGVAYDDAAEAPSSITFLCTPVGTKKFC